LFNYPVVSAFSKFESRRNGRSGVFAGSLGNVTFNESTLSENLRAGFEFEKMLVKNVIQVESAQITGREDVNETVPENLKNASPLGIIPPGSENFQIRDIKFKNFNWNNASALGTPNYYQG
jgi:hypothetical protein